MLIGLKLVRAYKTNGQKALQKEMKALMEQDEVRYYRIMAAFFPQKKCRTRLETPWRKWE